jgi:hypothetical protein
LSAELALLESDAPYENSALSGGGGTRTGRRCGLGKGVRGQADHRQQEGANGFESGHGEQCRKDAKDGGKRKSPSAGTFD